MYFRGKGDEVRWGDITALYGLLPWDLVEELRSA